MEALYSIILLSLLMPAILGCFLAANLVFPRNIIKLPVAFEIPLAVTFVIGFNIPLLTLIAVLNLKVCTSIQHLPAVLALGFIENPASRWELIPYFLIFSATPGLITFWIANHLKRAWEDYRKILPRYERMYGTSPKRSTQAAIVERFVLHQFAILTAYDSSQEELMVDVRTNDGFLISGKFQSYSLDGKELRAITMSNSIKFDLRDPARRPSAYLIPNSGELYFPNSSIADVHFWRLKKGSPLTVGLGRTELVDGKAVNIDPPSAIVRLAWYSLLQFALPKMKLRVVALLEGPVANSTVNSLLRQVAHCGLNASDIKIEFIDVSNK